MIATLYKPYRLGGAEVVFQHIVDELKKEHTVSILTSIPWNGFRSLRPTRTEEDGVIVYRFYPLNLFWFIDFLKKPAILRLLWHGLDMVNLHSYFITRSVIRHVKPDVVMTHNIKGIGYTIPRAICSMKVPHIHTLQDIQLHNPSGLVLYGEEKSFRNNNVLVYCYELVSRWLFGSPKTVVFSSRYLFGRYSERSFFKKSKTIIIPNPLPQSMFAVSSDKLHKDSALIHFAFFGQLEPHKGILFLIDTFKKWKQDNVRLHIGSRGSLEQEVLKRIAGDSRIVRVGFVEDLASFFKTMHYLIMPSLCYENSPLVTFESLANGTPVIVSRIGGAGEPIEDGVNGFQFVPGDEQDLLRVLNCAVAEIGQYDERSAYARESVKNYPIEKYVERLLSTVES